MTPPFDPVAAATHRDPYPHYADLVVRRPLYRDDALGLWVASSADTVTAVLTHAACRVRPPAEPVPAALVGSAAGAIFGRLIRMNDGARHGPLKQAATSTLESLDPNPDPARFDIARTAPRTFTFGVGPHACPGTMLATTIAAVGVDTLIASGLALDRLSETVSYRPSANARIPVFGTEPEASDG